ncbi:5529_t:CDS:2 [Paraglomus brasilianum]|uniref:5529_t:CDS:1 n=1 Tax=Paraglomus brasilianum TaxID=144538 RepID=A0A9N9A7T3_9GLOM|nr:5529_t:CDS:2 [Paraglomus brasilianum]
MDLSNVVKNFELPKAVKNFELPQAVKNIELPQAVKNIELPQAVKNFELPQAVKNIELPQAVKNIGLSETVKKIDIQGAIKNAEDAVKNIDIQGALKNVDEAMRSIDIQGAVKNVSEQMPQNQHTRRLSLFASSALTSVTSITGVIRQRVEETTKNLQNEHQQFVRSMKEETQVSRSGTQAVAPWEGLPEEEEMKKQILALSKDVRNLTMPPPENTSFQFDMAVHSPTAMAVLEHDPELSRLRFQLVPAKIEEEMFWRNYFYRVSLIKQTLLGSIDAIVLEKEVYHKDDNESEEESPDAMSKEKATGKEEGAEVLFDAKKSGDASGDDWIDDELAKTTAFDDTTLAKGTDLVDDDEVPEDWEDQMKAMSMLP